MAKGIAFSTKLATRPALRALFAAALIAVPLVVAFFCMCLGRYGITASEVAGVFRDKLTGSATMDDTVTKIVFTMRFPRVMLALLVGGGLSAAGVAFQSLFANPLATPDTLGVASGASFGAALALLLGMSLIYVQITALAAGFLAVLLTYLVGSGRGSGGGRGLAGVILGGMIIGSLFSALVSLIKYVADSESQLPAITYWLMGSLSSASFSTLKFGAPFIIAGLVLLFSIRYRLNLLTLSEDEARASGTNLPLLRLLASLGSTMITASSVSMCGQVGWVGLLCPHICRMALGNDNLLLVPASISLGAVFMVVIDTVARTATASEIPISILTALIGAPFFIALLRKTGGWSL